MHCFVNFIYGANGAVGLFRLPRRDCLTHICTRQNRTEHVHSVSRNRRGTEPYRRRAGVRYTTVPDCAAQSSPVHEGEKLTSGSSVNDTALHWTTAHRAAAACASTVYRTVPTVPHCSAAFHPPLICFSKRSSLPVLWSQSLFFLYYRTVPMVRYSTPFILLQYGTNGTVLYVYS